jgi:hypothetical protein
MVGKEDKESPDHHVRLEGLEPDMSGALIYFKDISGAIVVRHESGRGGEHPHLHVWFPVGKIIKPKALLDRFKKLPWANKKQFHGNEQWSSRWHLSVTNWIDYVTCQSPTTRVWWYRKAPKVLVNNSAYPILNLPPDDIKQDVDPEAVEAAASKTPTAPKLKGMSQHDKYMKYMDDKYSKPTGKIINPLMTMVGHQNPPTLRQCAKDYVLVCQCKYFARYGIPSIKHAFWKHNPNDREDIEERCVSEIMRLMTETF